MRPTEKPAKADSRVYSLRSDIFLLFNYHAYYNRPSGLGIRNRGTRPIKDRRTGRKSEAACPVQVGEREGSMRIPSLEACPELVEGFGALELVLSLPKYQEKSTIGIILLSTPALHHPFFKFLPKKPIPKPHRSPLTALSSNLPTLQLSYKSSNILRASAIQQLAHIR